MQKLLTLDYPSGQLERRSEATSQATSQKRTVCKVPHRRLLAALLPGGCRPQVGLRLLAHQPGWTQ